MGRPKLEIPNMPVSASIPEPLMRSLRERFAKSGIKTWSQFIAVLLNDGLRVQAGSK